MHPCKDKTPYDCEVSTYKHYSTIDPFNSAHFRKSIPNRLNHSTQILPPTSLIMSNTSSNIGNDIKDTVKGIHGAGEAIRGTFNQAVDTAFSDKASEAKNKAVAEKGIKEVEAADRNFGTRHGVKIGGVTDGTTTGAGAHSGAIGNMQSDPASTRNLVAEPTTRTDS